MQNPYIQPSQIDTFKIINEYKKVATQMLRLSFPMLCSEEIDEAINYSIIKRMKNSEVYVENNYKNKTIKTTLLDLAEYILQREPIITAYGVMFAKHGTVPNPIYKMIDTFIENRAIYKTEMFKYPKGSQDYQKYNLLQLLAKLDANALYGAMGKFSCIYYNLYVAASTTIQGKSAISAAILLFESFLADNVKFECLNEIITFIYNIINEEPNRKYNDSVILDSNILHAEVFRKVMRNCGFGWIPTYTEMEIVWNLLGQLSQKDLNRIYYKNNLYAFVDNKYVSCMLTQLLVLLREPFLNPNKPPKEIKVELDAFCNILMEYVYYSHQIIDRIPRTEVMDRCVAIICDTDSSIVCLDGWYRFVLEKVKNLDMNINRPRVTLFKKYKTDEFGDLVEKIPLFKKPKPLYDYDFNTKEIIELQSMNVTVEDNSAKDAVRHSIINIMGYCLGVMILDFMKKYAKCSNTSSDRECLLIMKNEWTFLRALLIGKKNYCDIQEIQEGHPVPKKESLSIMGMPIDKANLPKETRNRLKEVLYNDVLNVEDIDQLKILKDIAVIEKTIYNSIINGDKEYYKPVKIRSANGYSNPMGIQGIKASIAYNNLRDPNTSAIDLTIRNSIDIAKVLINVKTAEKIKDKNPSKYEQIINLLESGELGEEIDCVAIPLNEPVPEWLLDFIDYISIINDNLRNFPFEQIGFYRGNKTTVPYTNIIQI